MTPEQLAKLDFVYEFIQKLNSSTTIPYEVDAAFRERLSSILTIPDGLESAPLTAITAPSGGATVDSQARTAINSIITALEDLDLILPN